MRKMYRLWLAVCLASGGAWATPTKLNDTGSGFSAGAVGGNSSHCYPAGSDDPVGQDCAYGRDAQAQSGLLQKTGHSAPDIDPAYGLRNGLDYTKISNSGVALPAGANLGTKHDDWACTLDNVTGLMWEVKMVATQNHRYTWYDPDSPDGNVGSPSRSDFEGCHATGRCDTAKYIEDMNTYKKCGFNDWRMPTRKELLSLVDHGRTVPAIDPVFFPNTGGSYFWSGSPHVYRGAYAGQVNFYGGDSGFYGREATLYVRLVRTGP